MTSNLYAPNTTPSPLTPWVELSSERRLGRLHNYAGRGFTLACAAKLLATAPWELELFIQGLPGRQQPVFPAAVSKSGSDVWADLSPEERDHLALRPEPRNQIAGLFGFHLTTIRVWARKRDLLRRELPAKPKPPAAPRKRERTGANYVPDPTAEKLWFRLSLPERDEYIRGQDAANTSRISSAKALGVKITTLQKYANERGIFKTKPSSSNPWHDADVQGKRELLMRMAPNYGSKTELAKALRIGRDTLYNFTQRQKLDLPMGQPGQRRPAAPRTRPALVPGSTQPAPRAWLAAQADRPPADTPTRVHLLDARRNHCRFPLWPDAPKPKLADMFYCGAPVVNELESFCAHCLGLVRSRAPTAEEREEARQAYARNVRNGRPSGIKFGT